MSEIPNVTSTCGVCAWSNVEFLPYNVTAKQIRIAERVLDDQHHEKYPDCEGQLVSWVEK